MQQDGDLKAFFVWMDELNAEAVRRGLNSDTWPLPESVAHGENCWLIPFERGLSPAEAFDENEMFGPAGRRRRRRRRRPENL